MTNFEALRSWKGRPWATIVRSDKGRDLTQKNTGRIPRAILPSSSFILRGKPFTVADSAMFRSNISQVQSPLSRSIKVFERHKFRPGAFRNVKCSVRFFAIWRGGEWDGKKFSIPSIRLVVTLVLFNSHQLLNVSLTESFTILEPSDPEIGKHYVVRKLIMRPRNCKMFGRVARWGSCRWWQLSNSQLHASLQAKKKCRKECRE